MYDRILDLLLEAAIPQGTGPLSPGRMPTGSKRASKKAAMGAAASIKPIKPYDDTFRKEQQDMEDKLDREVGPERQEDEVESQAAKEGRQRMKDNDAEKELNAKWGVGGEKPKRKYRWADLSDEEYEKYKKEMAQVRKTSVNPEAMADLDRSRRRMRAQKNLDKFTSFGLGAKLGSAIGSAMSQPLVKSKPPKKFM